MIVDTLTYLGPARVIAAAGRHGYVQVELPDDEVIWARLALAVPYNPAVGDEVLVICQDPPESFVIGVLRGSGTTTLRVPGDLNLEAPRGSVCITAGKKMRLGGKASLELAAPRATFRFERLNVFADTLVQRATNMFNWATGLVQIKSRRLRCLADDAWLVRAGRAHIKTTDNTHIKGKTIHLG